MLGRIGILLKIVGTLCAISAFGVGTMTALYPEESRKFVSRLLVSAGDIVPDWIITSAMLWAFSGLLLLLAFTFIAGPSILGWIYNRRSFIPVKDAIEIAIGRTKNTALGENARRWVNDPGIPIINLYAEELKETPNITLRGKLPGTGIWVDIRADELKELEFDDDGVSLRPRLSRSDPVSYYDVTVRRSDIGKLVKKIRSYDK